MSAIPSNPKWGAAVYDLKQFLYLSDREDLVKTVEMMEAQIQINFQEIQHLERENLLLHVQIDDLQAEVANLHDCL